MTDDKAKDEARALRLLNNLDQVARPDSAHASEGKKDFVYDLLRTDVIEAAFQEVRAERDAELQRLRDALRHFYNKRPGCDEPDCSVCVNDRDIYANAAGERTK